MKMVSKILSSVRELYAQASKVEQQTDKSIASQLRDIAYLKVKNPTCGISDYYTYGLYDPEHATRDSYKTFAGWRIQTDLNLALNPRRVVSPAWDKLFIMILLEAYGLKYPQLKALYKETDMVPSGPGMHLDSIGNLKEFLQDSDPYPLYAKPVDCQQGIGGFYLIGYNRESDSVVTNDGSEIEFNEFIQKSINNPNRNYYRKEAGYLFQEIIPQHNDVNRFQGHDTVSSVRVVTIDTAEGTIPYHASWKLVVGDNPNDNFSAGKTGNLIAQIDIKTGVAEYGVDGYWPDANKRYKHPVTGNLFSDFKIPNWGHIISTVVKASDIVPLMSIKHWDIAIGENGPVFIELNDIGGIVGLQLHGHGFIDDNLIRLIKTKNDYHGYKLINKLVEKW